MEYYDWMIKYTPQKEWIERRGILLWLAFFFIELGAGMFFVSSFFQSVPGMLAGWIVCGVLGGGLHLLFLGKPLRFWRIVFSSGWQTSWISRGLIFVSLFLLLGLAHLGLSLSSGPTVPLLIASDILAFLTVIYGGFAMNYVNGIPLWNTALLPVLYVTSGLWGGAEVTLGMSLSRGDISLGISIEVWIRILLLGFILLVGIYLISVRYSSQAGRASVRQILSERWSSLFWGIVVILGIIVPLVAVVNSFGFGLALTPKALIYAAISCGLLGDLTMRYLILRCGMYSPLIYSGRPTIPAQ
jgi:formate-dependent nitrite reductase membrane component NrfD